jgi:hypothetical protein
MPVEKSETEYRTIHGTFFSKQVMAKRVFVDVPCENIIHSPTDCERPLLYRAKVFFIVKNKLPQERITMQQSARSV